MLRSQIEEPPKSLGSLAGGSGDESLPSRRKSSAASKSDGVANGNGFSKEIAKAADAREERKKRRIRKDRARTKKEKPSAASSSSSQGSIVWTVLVIGLIFCMVDVVYIMAKVDKHHTVATNLVESVAERTAQKAAGVVAVPAAVRRGGGGDGGGSDTSNVGKSGDKTPILNLLKEAGVAINPDVDKELYDELPTWDEVVGLYGDKPVIHGLEMCDDFQAHSDPADHFVSTAGTFNSGTNLMAELLIANCHMPARMAKYGAINRGVRWQVPWGKHTPPGDDDFRLTHKTDKDKDIDATNILPAVTIRDPLFWLGSMCKHQYAAHWSHDSDDCPNFSADDDLKAFIQYSDFRKYHDSIVHHWNDFYNEYMNVKFHRLIVRFEDLVFHAKEVTETVCHCAGGEMRRDGRFKYIVNSAKKGKAAHGKIRTGYLDAIVKYGSAAKQYAVFKRRSDLEYVRDNLDTNLVATMGYKMPDVTKFD